mmetsp:Transcript_166010/g.532909  ORF Transcript_166010/g.532909 Transcript_166010/m.532909 type:complete len:117 (-) Transcript_166010:410-760(-)
MPCPVQHSYTTSLYPDLRTLVATLADNPPASSHTATQILRPKSCCRQSGHEYSLLWTWALSHHVSRHSVWKLCLQLNSLQVWPQTLGSRQTAQRSSCSPPAASPCLSTIAEGNANS